jgi:hypothetical protein
MKKILKGSKSKISFPCSKISSICVCSCIFTMLEKIKFMSWSYPIIIIWPLSFVRHIRFPMLKFVGKELIFGRVLLSLLERCYRKFSFLLSKSNYINLWFRSIDIDVFIMELIYDQQSMVSRCIYPTDLIQWYFHF